MRINMQFLTFISMSVMALCLSACETMGGAGRDMQSAGQSIEEAAD